MSHRGEIITKGIEGTLASLKALRKISGPQAVTILLVLAGGYAVLSNLGYELSAIEVPSIDGGWSGAVTGEATDVTRGSSFLLTTQEGLKRKYGDVPYYPLNTEEAGYNFSSSWAPIPGPNMIRIYKPPAKLQDDFVLVYETKDGPITQFTEAERDNFAGASFVAETELDTSFFAERNNKRIQLADNGDGTSTLALGNDNMTGVSLKVVTQSSELEGKVHYPPQVSQTKTVAALSTTIALPTAVIESTAIPVVTSVPNPTPPASTSKNGGEFRIQDHTGEIGAGMLGLAAAILGGVGVVYLRGKRKISKRRATSLVDPSPSSVSASSISEVQSPVLQGPLSSEEMQKLWLKEIQTFDNGTFEGLGEMLIHLNEIHYSLVHLFKDQYKVPDKVDTKKLQELLDRQKDIARRIDAQEGNYDAIKQEITSQVAEIVAMVNKVATHKPPKSQ